MGQAWSTLVTDQRTFIGHTIAQRTKEQSVPMDTKRLRVNFEPLSDRERYSTPKTPH